MSNSNESYIREHKLKQLMEFLMEQLLNKKPSNPEKYLIKILERRQSLLAEKPKTVSFKRFCKIKTAFLRWIFFLSEGQFCIFFSKPVTDIDLILFAS